MNEDQDYNETPQSEAVDKEKRDPNAALQIVSLSQADNQSFCECEKCSALDQAGGSHSTAILSFVNQGGVFKNLTK